MYEWDRGLLESQVFFLRGLHRDSVTHRFTCSGPQPWGSSSKSTRDIRDRTELTSFRVRDVVQLSLGTKAVAAATVPFVEPFTPSQQARLGIKSLFFINVANTIHPALVIPRHLPIQCMCPAQATSRVFSTQEACLSSCFRLS